MNESFIVSTKILQKPMLQSKARAKGMELVASTLAIATLATPLVPADVPTYISNLPSELINSFFSEKHINLELENLFFSIRSYSTYQENWDGYSGKPPSAKTIKDTLYFLKQLPLDIPLPYSGLSGDGEISLFWDKNDIFADLGFTGDGKYSYYARGMDGKEYHGNYIPLSSTLPEDFVKVLKKIIT